MGARGNDDIARPEAAAYPGSLRSVTCPIVVGRADELALLDHALARARNSLGGVVLLVGEAGIGKSRMTQEAAARAGAAGMRVLRGRAVQTTAPIPFRPVAEAINSELRVSDPPDAQELRPFRRALGAFVPQWADEREPDEPSSMLLLEGVLRLLRVLASDAGSLLILEDLHWADADSLAVVEYLADNLGDSAVLCLATIRSDEPGAALTAADRLGSRRAATRVDLERISPADVQEMTRASLDVEPPRALVRAIVERADGIPFLVEELLAAYIAGGGPTTEGWSWGEAKRAATALPTSFRDLVRARLASLDRDERAVVEAAALLGPSFDWSLLPAITGLDRDRVLDGLRAGVGAQLIATFEHGFRFRHALIPETILAELLPPERVELSARAARTIEETFPGLPGDWCEHAADLREAAGDLAAAASHLQEAGARALKRGALSSAEAHLERARSHVLGDNWHRMGVDRLLIDVLVRAGKTARIREIGADLLTFFSSKFWFMDQTTIASVHHQLARSLGAAGDWTAARSHRERAEELAKREENADLMRSLRVLEARERLAGGDLDSAETIANDILTSGGTDLVELRCELQVVLGEVASRRGDIDDAARAFEEAMRTAEQHGLVAWRVRAMLELGSLEAWLGTTARLEEARDLAAQTGAVSSEARAELAIGCAEIMRFRLDAADRALERCAELSRMFRLALEPDVRAAVAVVHASRGERLAMDEALAEVGESKSASAIAVGHVARAILALREERPGEAATELDAAMSSHGDLVQLPVVPGLRALLAALRGSDASVTKPAGEAPVSAAGFSLARAISFGRAGEPDDARRTYAAADEALAPFPGFRHMMRRLVAEAAVEDDWGDPGSWLLETIPFLEEHGLGAMAKAGKAMLKRLGVPVPRRGRGDSPVPASLRALGLTSREIDVLRLVAAGLSNRQIAERLVLSPRTVETHVASLTRKVGVADRSELIAFAADVAPA